jgi:hypothetical protein
MLTQRRLGLTLPEMWYLKVIDGIRQEARYQEGDTVLQRHRETAYIESIIQPLPQKHGQRQQKSIRAGRIGKPRQNEWSTEECNRYHLSRCSQMDLAMETLREVVPGVASIRDGGSGSGGARGFKRRETTGTQTSWRFGWL